MSKRNRRNTLAACIIARDEEDVLPNCLASLADAHGPIYDELVIGIDTRTTDATRTIAIAAGARIVDIRWPEEGRDFAAARNQVELASTAEYLYWQDADEVLINGHQVIRDIVRAGELMAVKPVIVVSRDRFGAKEQAYPRQDLLHRRGTHRWTGKLHEQTEGPPGAVRADIEVEQIERPGGDRPHGDTFAMLRDELADGSPWNERNLFYLAREHAGHEHDHEALALIEKLMQHKSPTTGYPLQSSHACLIAGEISNKLGDAEEARRWFMRAIEHWAAWAEPHYAIGVLCYSIALQHLERKDVAADVVTVLFEEAVGWLMAASQYQPPAYYTDLTLYAWRRYEALGVCLARIGRIAEAVIWLQRAAAGCPEHDGLKQQLAQLMQEAA